MIKIHTNNFGKGINRWAEKDGKLIATIHQHKADMPGSWSVNWATGRVDWHNSYAEAKDNALKGN